mgnify:FL=1
MKKIFTLFAAALMSLSAMAEDYNCHLAITSNDTPCDPTEAILSVNKQENGKYEVILHTLTVTLSGSPTTIENIDIKDVDGKVEDNDIILTTNQTIKINALGMELNVPINLYATISEDNVLDAYLKIPIMGMLEVNVLISSEDFGEATFDVNPSFMSICGVEVSNFSADKTEYDITLPKLPENLEDIIAGNDMATENENIFVCTYYYKESKKKLTVFVNTVDLKKVKTYTFKVTIDPTGINNVVTSGNRTVLGRYNANGQKVGSNAKGLVITKYSDGTAVKSVK